MNPAPPSAGADPIVIQGNLVFLHGLAGFNHLGPIHYYRGLPQMLADWGLKGHFPQLSPAGTIPQRAAQLADYVAELHGPVHLIAHSMGGLDARYLAAQLDPQRRIRSITTLATPHRGSALADWLGTTQGPLQWLLRAWLGRAVADLTPAACAAFNRDIPDRADIRYRSWAACRPYHQTPKLLAHWNRLLRLREGANDSQVSLASAQWGEYQGQVRADHFELIGWNLGLPYKPAARPFHHRALYRCILETLAQDP